MMHRSSAVQRLQRVISRRVISPTLTRPSRCFSAARPLCTAQTGSPPTDQSKAPQQMVGTQGTYTHQNLPEWLTAFINDYTAKIQALADPKANTYEIRLFSPEQWVTKPFEFHTEFWRPNEMTDIQKRRLCIGDTAKQYTLIGEAFAFPVAEDHPIIHESNAPAKIWWDISSKTPKLLVQLSEHLPPLLWLSIAPKIDALKKVLEEFLQTDSRCMQKNLSEAEASHERICRQLGADADTIASKKHQMKDLYLNELRQKPPTDFAVDWENDTCVYVGSCDSLPALERTWMKTNPFVFGWPMLMSDGNVHMENRSVQLAAFRTILSKSIILLTCRRDLQVNTQRLVKAGNTRVDLSVADELTMETPVFLYINYPKNTKMSGGEAFVKRFNQLMKTNLPTDLPVDVLGVLCRESLCKTSDDILAEAQALNQAILGGAVSQERHPRLPSLLHSTTRAVGELAYNIMYLASMQYPAWEVIFAQFAKHPESTVRLALAKGSMILEKPELVRSLVEHEAEVGVKESLSKLLEDSAQGQ